MVKKIFSLFLVVILGFATGGYVHAEGVNRTSKKMTGQLKQKIGIKGKQKQLYTTNSEDSLTEKDFKEVMKGAEVATLVSGLGAREKVQYIDTVEEDSESMAVISKVTPDNSAKKDRYVDVIFYSNVDGELYYDGALDFDLESEGPELGVVMPKEYYVTQEYIYMGIGIYNDMYAEEYNDDVLFKVKNPYYDPYFEEDFLAAPTVNPVTDSDIIVTGTTRGDTEVLVNDTEYNEIGSAVVDRGHTKFTVKIPAQKAGTKLYVYAVSTDGNLVSDDTIVTVLSTLKVNTLGDNQKTITGTATPDAIVHAKVGTKQIGTNVTAGKDGKYSITIPVQKAGTKVTVYVKTGNSERNVTVTVVDKTAPAKPTVNAVFDKDTTVTGTAEAGATVSVKVGTSVKGSAKADAKGKYSVKIAAQKGGTTLTINAQDAAKNTSASQTVKVVNTAITVKTVKVTDMKKYDGGKNQLTFINGKGYSQFFYENTSGNYQFVPSSWLKAAGLTVEVKTVNGKKFLFITNPYLSSTPGKVTAPPTLPNISVKTTAVTDMKKYDGGSNSLTFINGKAYSQFFYENNSGNYQFVPSSWLKAAGLTVEVKKTGNVKRLYIANPYKK